MVSDVLKSHKQAGFEINDLNDGVGLKLGINSANINCSMEWHLKYKMNS